MFNKGLKITILILLLIISIICISSLSATSSDFYGEYNQDEVMNFQVLINDFILNSECCSVVLQIDNNHTIYSFRRDANFSADIFIHEDKIAGKKCIKQYKLDGGYFTQSIITNDGLVVSIGGINDGDKNKMIENITSQMIESSNYTSNLTQIQDIFNGDGLGHYLLKFPNGTYYIVFSNKIMHGHLEPGEYLSVPNRLKYFRSGNFSTSDPIGKAIELESTDIFGLDRRDTTVYDIIINDSRVNIGVYATNDGGDLRGLKTKHLYDDLNVSGNITKGENLPIAPNRIHIGSFVLEKDNGIDFVQLDFLKQYLFIFLDLIQINFF